MKFILEINNQTSYKFSRNFFLNIFKYTAELAEIELPENKKLEMSLAFVSEFEIAKLNMEYRQKKAPTDVLSFCEYEKKEQLLEEKLDTVFLGELIACPSIIEQGAVEDGEGFDFALTYIIAHGVLHLLGFEHGKKMFALQAKVAQDLA